MAEEKGKTYTNLILVVLLVAASFLLGTFWMRIKSLEKTPTSEEKEQAQASPVPAEEAVLGELASTLGSFNVSDEEICLENGKPLIYMFGSSGCPHCSWEHPVFGQATAKFGNLISLHDNMDTQDDMEIFEKYSQVNQGGIPFIVLGCRYLRVGSGEMIGEEEEERVLTALICKLTEGEPEEICGQVEDLTSQVE
ncbi:MAG TPA: hypothetical protein VMX77_01455 [Candidatus Bathyarchaeia archaeon]|nr:hypothetical protein [Candidatus Bathyarchaeia archaeon]